MSKTFFEHQTGIHYAFTFFSNEIFQGHRYPITSLGIHKDHIWAPNQNVQ